MLLMHAHPTRCIQISLVAKWNETLTQILVRQNCPMSILASFVNKNVTNFKRYYTIEGKCLFTSVVSHSIHIYIEDPYHLRIKIN